MPPKTKNVRPSRATKDAEVKKSVVAPTIAKKPAAKAKAKKPEPAPKAAAKVAKAPAKAAKKPTKKIKMAEDVPNHAPPTTASRKRAASTASVEVPTKRQKKQRESVPLNINAPPTQKLDVYVFGGGDGGELGLGPGASGAQKVKDVQRPRLNKLLDSKTVGVVQVAVGGMHCVALTHDQKILTWGVNDNCALGRDTAWEAPTRDADADSDSDDDDESGLNPRESTPTALSKDDFPADISGFAQVVATNSASFALTLDGLVYGWGTFCGNDGIWGFFKEDAAKGVKKQQRPALIPQLKNIKALASGGDHVLALDQKGNIWAWGCGEQGQLGHRVAERRRLDYLVPNPVGVPKNKITSISAGGYNGFALDIKGQIWTWGLNNFGQAGIPNGAGDNNALVQRPSVVKSLKPYDIKSIVGGAHHSIACAQDGTLLTWGRCDDSQIGVLEKDLPKDDLLFDSRDRPRILKEPFAVPDIKADYVAAGIDDCIVITKEGQAYSWGFSANYRTGHGTEDPVEKATLIDNTAVRGKKLSFAGCGGQFSILAGPAV